MRFVLFYTLTSTDASEAFRPPTQPMSHCLPPLRAPSPPAGTRRHVPPLANLLRFTSRLSHMLVSCLHTS